MKRLKSLFLVLVALVVFVGLGAISVKAEGKVKVYIFEAGGCPYCEAEIEYLQGLSSYNEKFEIIQKELYVDHVDWVQGADFELGKAVAEAFKSAGFTDASYQGTPFVIISNIYAASAYSTNLESYIDKAYEEGDKDVVGCYASGGSNCLEGADPSISVDVSGDSNSDDSKDVETITTIVLLLIIVGSIALVIYTGKKNEEAKIVEKIYKEEKKESENKPAKKVNQKKSNKKK